ncbi:DNA polymerase III subunit delta [Candidatus Pelagibacter bacterium nBUS_32]|jgi:DNA polymerase III subunit delta|uniref:DNA polymerase III subunit delta n=1 Tax=Candidatus Pelagibacter bacterium nBUS_32 TaxID=3374192 RepID=UPI003EBAF18B
MILKSYEIKKLDLEKNNLVLFYGQNEGAKEEEISKLLEINNNITINTYDEKQILDNQEILYNEILSKSLFDDKKIIIINRATEKILNTIENLLNKNLSDISIIINSNILDKKSKLRSLFEKDKKLICVAFYPDTPEILSRFTNNFLRQNNITMSQSHINLIINKCNSDRGVLKNEMQKIKFFCLNKKKLSAENLLKLINLIENYSISELIDNCLAKNKKKTIGILNENNFSNEDCIIFTRTLLNKLKKILKLSKEFKENKDINKTISNAKPPIFWKDKELIKQQIIKWTPKEIIKLIYNVNEMEILVKKNSNNSVNIMSDFILNLVSLDINNEF